MDANGRKLCIPSGGKAVSQNALGRLHDLAVFVGAEEDLRTHLGELVDLAASVTDAATCSIMLLSEGEHDAPRLKLWCSTEVLPSSAWNETPGRGESIAGRVLEQSAPLLIADIRASEFAPLARQRDNLGVSFICTPIAVGKHVIGVMNLSSRLDSPPFDESDLGLAEIVATLIGKSVQVELGQRGEGSRRTSYGWHGTAGACREAACEVLLQGSGVRWLRSGSNHRSRLRNHYAGIE
jgi:transcriptional regulator with GAF, ATPase, and Fis domain